MLKNNADPGLVFNAGYNQALDELFTILTSGIYGGRTEAYEAAIEHIEKNRGQ